MLSVSLLDNKVKKQLRLVRCASKETIAKSKMDSEVYVAAIPMEVIIFDSFIADSIGIWSIKHCCWKGVDNVRHPKFPDIFLRSSFAYSGATLQEVEKKYLSEYEEPELCIEYLLPARSTTCTTPFELAAKVKRTILALLSMKETLKSLVYGYEQNFTRPK